MRWSLLPWTAATCFLGCGPGIALGDSGVAIFNEHCAACHQAGGVGAPGLAPPLVSRMVSAAAQRNPSYAALVVLNGLSGSIALDDGSTMAGIMPPVGLGLADEDVAAVLNYVFDELNGAKPALDAGIVAGLRSQKPTAKTLRSMRDELAP